CKRLYFTSWVLRCWLSEYRAVRAPGWHRGRSNPLLHATAWWGHRRHIRRGRRTGGNRRFLSVRGADKRRWRPLPAIPHYNAAHGSRTVLACAEFEAYRGSFLEFVKSKSFQHIPVEVDLTVGCLNIAISFGAKDACDRSAWIHGRSFHDAFAAVAV